MTINAKWSPFPLQRAMIFAPVSSERNQGRLPPGKASSPSEARPRLRQSEPPWPRPSCSPRLLGRVSRSSLTSQVCQYERGPDHRRKEPDGLGQCLSQRTRDAEATRQNHERRGGSPRAPGQPGCRCRDDQGSATPCPPLGGRTRRRRAKTKPDFVLVRAGGQDSYFSGFL